MASASAAQLDSWPLRNRGRCSCAPVLAGRLSLASEDTVSQGAIALRRPQVGALHAIHAHWSVAGSVATIVMPTGTGKTETMLATTVSCQCERILALVPTDAPRSQVAEKFLTLGILKDERSAVLDASAQRPVVGVLTSAPRDVAEVDAVFGVCNIVVTTSQLAARCDASQVFRCLISPLGGRAFVPDGTCSLGEDGDLVLNLFHHTTNDAVEAINSSGHFRGSRWNVQGTRELKNVEYAYFTSLPKISSDEDLTKIAMASSGRLHLLRTNAASTKEAIAIEVSPAVHTGQDGDLAYRGAGKLGRLSAHLSACAKVRSFPLRGLSIPSLSLKTRACSISVRMEVCTPEVAPMSRRTSAETLSLCFALAVPEGFSIRPSRSTSEIA